MTNAYEKTSTFLIQRDIAYEQKYYQALLFMRILSIFTYDSGTRQPKNIG